MQMAAQDAQYGEAAATASRRDWIGLAVIALPCLLYSMDLTVLNLAVPALSRELRPTAAQMLWIIDIYGFVLSGMLITMGALGDRIGRRRLLLFGAAAFALASILAAFAKSADTLIAMRAALGIAGATLAPATLSLIRNMFQNERERAIAISIWCASYSAGAAVGPIVGGVLLQYFWWGSVFLIGLPVMALLLVLGPVLLPEYREPENGRMDLTSAALSLSAILTTIYGLKRLAEYGLSWRSGLWVCTGLLLGWLFIGRQSRTRFPLINLALFRNRVFSAATVTYTLGCFASFGSLIFIAQYLQSVLGLSPIEAGLWSLPFGITCIAGATMTPFLTRYVRSDALMIGALGLSAAGFMLLTGVDESTTPAIVAAICCSYAFGLSCVFTLATDLIVGSAPPEQVGTATAVSETGSELGGALGIALLGCIGMVVYRVALARAMSPGDPLLTGTIGAAADAAREIGGPAGAMLLQISRAAFMESFRAAAAVAALVLIATAILMARCPPLHQSSA